VYCPKYTELRPLPCPDPPNKEVLMTEVVRLTADKGFDMGASEFKVPDRDWLLHVIAIFDKDHEIFKKEYLPPAPLPKKEELVIDNNDSFFTGLPYLTKKKDIKAISKLKSYKVSKFEERIKKMKE